MCQSRFFCLNQICKLNVFEHFVAEGGLLGDCHGWHEGELTANINLLFWGLMQASISCNIPKHSLFYSLLKQLPSFQRSAMTLLAVMAVALLLSTLGQVSW